MIYLSENIFRHGNVYPIKFVHHEEDYLDLHDRGFVINNSFPGQRTEESSPFRERISENTGISKQ